jgi:hypothetical protein
VASDDELVQHAERDVINAAQAWSKEPQRLTEKATPASERLRTAVYMLNRARTITGKVRLEEIQRAMQEQEKKPEPEK